MSKTLWRFVVEFSTEKEPCSSLGVKVSDIDVFDKISALGFETQTPAAYQTKSRGFINIVDEPEGSERLKKALTILCDGGYLPYSRGIVPPQDRDQYFPTIRRRIYTSKELSKESLLRLNPRPLRIADIQGQRDGVPILQISKRLSSKRKFGNIDTQGDFYVTKEARDQLKKHHLHGLTFEPAVFHENKKSPKPLYRLQSTVTLPVSTTPRCDEQGLEVVDPATPAYWNGDCYRPPEISYATSDLKELPDWDVALTKEWFMRGPYRQQELIINQKFREALRLEGMKECSMLPVRIQ